MISPDPARPDGHESLAFTLLVVDDHAAIRELVMTLVATRYPRCRLLEAQSAEDALVLCGTEPPDLIVLDITLPGMDGFEATRRIKELCPQTVIVMHSSSDQPVYQAASLAAGASAFVGKGRNSRTLVPVIASLMPTRGEPLNGRFT
jgi:two-component system, NarL family, response regulator LiaR